MRILTWFMAIGVLLCALYIMVNRLGLVPGLGFGAGAYYYADIPDFERFLQPQAYRSPVPMWLCIILFLAWGFLVYRLWVWLDKRNNRHPKE